VCAIKLVSSPRDTVHGESEEEKEEHVEQRVEEQQQGADLTLDHLATIVTTAQQLQRAAEEWSPHMFRLLQFVNTIDRGMSVHTILSRITQKR